MHLIIADHTLKDYQGHSFEYCKSVREIAIAKGWKVTTLGTSHISEHRSTKRIKCNSTFFAHDFFPPLSHSIPISSSIPIEELQDALHALAGIIDNIVIHYFTDLCKTSSRLQQL